MNSGLERWHRERLWDFTGKIVIITGGGRGIGAATAKILHHLGAMVYVTYRSSRESAEKLVKNYGESGRLHILPLDVTNPKEVRKAINYVSTDAGRIDALINNASYSSAYGWKTKPVDIPGDEILKTLQTDLMGSWYCDQSVIPIMQQQGSGVIIHLASSAALMGDADTLLYTPAKVGLMGLTRSLARSLAPTIRVNAVGPGSVRTQWLDNWNLTPEEIKTLAEEVPLKRLVEPEEIAWTIAFLLSPAAAGITGQTWLVDGGMTFH